MEMKMNPDLLTTSQNELSKKEKDKLKRIDTNELAQLLKVLSEPNRLLLLDKIIEGVQCNCEMGKSLTLAPNLVSHHLSVLCDSGIVETARDENDARWIYYSINKEKLGLMKKHFNQFFEETRIKPCMSSCGPKLIKKN